jgi:hypothetical protein
MLRVAPRPSPSLRAHPPLTTIAGGTVGQSPGYAVVAADSLGRRLVVDGGALSPLIRLKRIYNF